MNTYPIITFVVPTFNSAATIERTLASVYGQIDPQVEIEVIVIDGLSSDDTTKRVAKFRAFGPRVVSEPDNGIYDAMNKGARLAAGEFLWFLNSDDWLVPEAIGRVKMIIDHEAPNFIYGDANLVKQGSSQAYGLSKGVTVKQFSRALKRGLPFCHQASLIRRELFHDMGGFRTRFRFSSEYELFRRIESSGYKGIYLPVRLVNYQDGGASHGVHVFLEQATIMKRQGDSVLLAYSRTVSSVMKFLLRETLPHQVVSVASKLKKGRFRYDA